MAYAERETRVSRRRPKSDVLSALVLAVVVIAAMGFGFVAGMSHASDDPPAAFKNAPVVTVRLTPQGDVYCSTNKYDLPIRHCVKP